MNGFEIAFERNYNLAADSRQYQLVELGQILEDHVVDSDPSNGPSTDQKPLDYLEQLISSVPAPGPSLVSAASRGQRQRVEIQNCQTWLRAGVALLVQNGVMDQSALQAVDDAPKN
ncbi:hypothetical protein PTNB73_08930 [Pyrenophora teres f. teres]|nr:hypothetical protein PTNB85_08530 [Pyrenophora teres f. teres]KAE8855027.1 hypothetical protein PTNB29_09278 [Pyrenophora teres f. teres]KAE8857682.1 hypothetical protein PTNB73_08930 [Pyrenophora teres f. teres]CAA9966148.1 hypothetical protein PTMSG1_09507 [Pyrenophora teres f. maculata]